MNNNNAYVELS